MDSQNTDQKLAVITGGASGIGLSCSKRFAKEGYAVLIIDATLIIEPFDALFFIARSRNSRQA